MNSHLLQLHPMQCKKVLTIDPIWVWAIFAGLKTVENRSWSTKYRGPLWIHAGLNTRREPFAREWLQANTVYEPPTPETLASGVAGRIFGCVDVVDCVPLADVQESDREFAVGPWCWILRSPVRFLHPIPATGKQGFWSHDISEVHLPGV